MELMDIIRSEIRAFPQRHLYDFIREIGVTHISEDWKSRREVELTLSGVFKEEDIVMCFYKYCPAMYKLTGNITKTIEICDGYTYTASFSRDT